MKILNYVLNVSKTSKSFMETELAINTSKALPMAFADETHLAERQL